MGSNPILSAIRTFLTIAELRVIQASRMPVTGPGDSHVEFCWCKREFSRGAGSRGKMRE
jgi:hypothetical protein